MLSRSEHCVYLLKDSQCSVLFKELAHVWHYIITQNALPDTVRYKENYFNKIASSKMYMFQTRTVNVHISGLFLR